MTADLVRVAERDVALSSLDRVLYPATGTTKAEVIDYDVRVAPYLLPHVAGRPVTPHRFPVPLAGAAYDVTKAYARRVAGLLTRETPALVVEHMTRALRPGKVLVDWSQDDRGKSTVAPYSLRALRVPSVSMPVTWDEVAAGAGGDLSMLFWSPAAALERLAGVGDLFAPVLHSRRRLSTDRLNFRHGACAAVRLDACTAPGSPPCCSSQRASCCRRPPRRRRCRPTPPRGPTSSSPRSSSSAPCR